MAEKFLSTEQIVADVLSSCCFIYNTRRDRYSCRKRIRYCNTDDTRARSSSEIGEKRNGQKNNF